jgi:hypothetical protein
MGYTHYWNLQLDTPRPMIDKALADCRKIMRKFDTYIAGWDGEVGVKCDLEGVAFNGRGDEGHESFHFPPKMTANFDENTTFSFCKTARKEYDLVVVACLAAIADRLGKYVDVSSDGNESDWTDGVAAANEAIDREIPNPLEGK